jgi:hypothetical protein
MGITELFWGIYRYGEGSWRSPSGCAAWQQMVEVSLHHYITSSADLISRLHLLGALAHGISPIAHTFRHIYYQSKRHFPTFFLSQPQAKRPSFSFSSISRLLALFRKHSKISNLVRRSRATHYKAGQVHMVGQSPNAMLRGRTGDRSASSHNISRHAAQYKSRHFSSLN